MKAKNSASRKAGELERKQRQHAIAVDLLKGDSFLTMAEAMRKALEILRRQS